MGARAGGRRARAGGLAEGAGGAGGGARGVVAQVPAPGHDRAGHPECAGRGLACARALEAPDLAAARTMGELEELPPGILRPAAGVAVARVHSGAYADALRAVDLGSEGQAVVEGPSQTYLRPSTVDDCLLAAGAAVQLVDVVLSGGEKGGGGAEAGRPPPLAFGLVRPPGHHATPASSATGVRKGSRARAMGFCVINSVAVAARHAQDTHGLERVAVIDLDVHHGNGTEDTFYEDGGVLFCSVHQDRAYPGTGRARDAGAGLGEGRNVNIPLPAGAGDAAARRAFEEVVAPAVERFEPELLLVSAGFDAHWSDPLASLQYQSSTFHALGAGVADLARRACEGRAVFLLEGGYHLGALEDSVAETLRALLGLPSRPLMDSAAVHEEPAARVRRALAEARAVHGL